MQSQRQSRVSRIASSLREVLADVNYTQHRHAELNTARAMHSRFPRR